MRGQKVEGRSQVTGSPVFGQAPHQFVSQVWIVGDLAAIQIDRQRDVALAGELFGLLLHPVVQSPPLVDHDERWKRPFAGRSVENSVDGVVAGFVGNSLAIDGEGRKRQRERQNQREEKTFHTTTPEGCSILHANRKKLPQSKSPW